MIDHPAPQRAMKAAISDRFGPPDVLRVEDLPAPTPAAGEVLIRVRAASINAWDLDLLRGTRVLGFRSAHRPIIGADVSGRNEAVGSAGGRFHRGDDVFGDLSGVGWGGFAEFVAAPESALVPKPPSVTFEEAAAVPQAASMALKGLREIGRDLHGRHILVNGAGGGVGSFAVQMAKAFGAEVTGVDRREKLDMVRSIGADGIIDFEREDYTRHKEQYDGIVDMALFRSAGAPKRALKRGGTTVVVGGGSLHILRGLTVEPLLCRAAGKRMKILMHQPNWHLYETAAMVEEGRVKAVIDRRFRLEDIQEALRYFASGQTKGKLVITMGGG